MYTLFYGILTSLARPLLRLVRIFHGKIDEFLTDRSNAQEVPRSKRKIWIHCSSLGEFEMAKPIIYEVLKKHDVDDLLITFFSPSGYREAKRSRFASCSMYLPLDLVPYAKNFYKKYEPEIAIFIRYDIWYNFVKIGLKRGVKFYLVNARFQDNHKLFSSLGSPYAGILKKFDQIFCSDQHTMENLAKRNFSNIQYTGDIRFDRVHHNSMEVQAMPDVVAFKGNNKLLVLGSSWQQEEDLLLELLAKKPNNLKVIIAPHVIRDERIAEIEETFSAYKVKRYTRKDFGPEDDIVIFNTIGILSKVYHYADLALVGGGFSGRLHNIIEPAVFGSFISFGPEIEKFPEATDFIESGFGYAIKDKEKWVQLMLELLQDPDRIEDYKSKAKEFVRQRLGANTKIMAQLKI